MGIGGSALAMRGSPPPSLAGLTGTPGRGGERDAVGRSRCDFRTRREGLSCRESVRETRRSAREGAREG